MFRSVLSLFHFSSFIAFVTLLFWQVLYSEPGGVPWQIHIHVFAQMLHQVGVSFPVAATLLTFFWLVETLTLNLHPYLILLYPENPPDLKKKKKKEEEEETSPHRVTLLYLTVINKMKLSFLFPKNTVLGVVAK